MARGSPGPHRASGTDATDPVPGMVDEDADERLTVGQHAWSFLRELLVVVVGALVVAALLRAFVGQMFLIPSSSMENTLQVSDRVVVEKLSTVKRGEVVVFADPGGWLADIPAEHRGLIGRALEFIGVLPDTGTEHLIKRVIGLPGDEVKCCDSAGRILVNGQALDETSYLYTAPDGQQVQPSEFRFDVMVPAGRLFVMGDHRDDSRDSRCHLNDPGSGRALGDNAFVPEDVVVGRAFAVVWPLSDAKRLAIPPTFAGLPPGTSPPPSRAQVEAGPEASC